MKLIGDTLGQGGGAWPRCVIRDTFIKKNGALRYLRRDLRFPVHFAKRVKATRRSSFGRYLVRTNGMVLVACSSWNTLVQLKNPTPSPVLLNVRKSSRGTSIMPHCVGEHYFALKLKDPLSRFTSRSALFNFFLSMSKAANFGVLRDA